MCCLPFLSSQRRARLKTICPTRRNGHDLLIIDVPQITWTLNWHNLPWPSKQATPYRSSWCSQYQCHHLTAVWQCRQRWYWQRQQGYTNPVDSTNKDQQSTTSISKIISCCSKFTHSKEAKLQSLHLPSLIASMQASHLPWFEFHTMQVDSKRWKHPLISFCIIQQCTSSPNVSKVKSSLPCHLPSRFHFPLLGTV